MCSFTGIALNPDNFLFNHGNYSMVQYFTALRATGFNNISG